MFYRYLSIFFKLRSVDISSWNTDKVTTFNRMFWNCQKLTDVKFDCSKTSLTEAGVKEIFTNTTGGRNSKSFLTQYCTYSVY